MPPTRPTRRRHTAAALTTITALTALVAAGTAAATPDRLFTLTNDPAGNRVQVIDVRPGGALSLARSHPTGGLGTGAGLGSQGAVVVEGRDLLAVSAGSDELSLFTVGRRGLQLEDVVPAGGDMPVSVTTDGRRAYVVNAGSADITGFEIEDDRLVAIPGAHRPLSRSGAGPAQIELSPDGSTLVVTEKATNLIGTFPVAADGSVGSGTFTPSAGPTPFGFAITRAGVLVTSEAAGGAPDASLVSSYRLSGGVAPISGAVPTTETAACWIALSADERFAYSTNTGSDSVSGFRIGRDGSLAPLDADGVAGRTGDGPIDAVTVSRRLFTLNAADDTVSGFFIRWNGRLAPAPGLAGLPPASVGLAAG